MKPTTFLLLIFIFMVSTAPLLSSIDSLYIRVHFLHGSKPKKKYRYEEDRWFGGVLGGHAGIEYQKNKVLDFVPKARFHFFAKKRIINSKFSLHDTLSFYALLGGAPDSNKKTMITIPVTRQQKDLLDSLALVYQKSPPYDYAFFGMRCGAAAYDVLAHAGILPAYGFGQTWRRIFYPRKLRRLLERQATTRHYTIRRCPGSSRRIWEKD